MLEDLYNEVSISAEYVNIHFYKDGDSQTYLTCSQYCQYKCHLTAFIKELIRYMTIEYIFLVLLICLLIRKFIQRPINLRRSQKQLCEEGVVTPSLTNTAVESKMLYI